MYVNHGVIFGISRYGRHIHFQEFCDVKNGRQLMIYEIHQRKQKTSDQIKRT